MVDTAQLTEYKAGQDEIDRLVRRDVQQLWDGIGVVEPDRKRDLLMDLIPGLVVAFGPIAATLAAEFFEDTVGSAAVLGAAVPDEAVTQSTRSVIGGLWNGSPGTARDRLTELVVRHTRQYGRSTIRASVEASGSSVRFARILSYSSKRGPCAWCRMLASRGAVYHSEITAGGLDHWHDTCRCDAVAVRSPDDFPGDVDGYAEIVVQPGTDAWVPKELYGEYAQVHDYLDDDRAVAKKMRDTFGYR